MLRRQRNPRATPPNLQSQLLPHNKCRMGKSLLAGCVAQRRCTEPSCRMQHSVPGRIAALRFLQRSLRFVYGSVLF